MIELFDLIFPQVQSLLELHHLIFSLPLISVPAFEHPLHPMQLRVDIIELELLPPNLNIPGFDNLLKRRLDLPIIELPLPASRQLLPQPMNLLLDEPRLLELRIGEHALQLVHFQGH
jgi:hypothetical protein